MQFTRYEQEQENTALDDSSKKISLETLGGESDLNHTEKESIYSKDEERSKVRFSVTSYVSKGNDESFSVKDKEGKKCLQKNQEQTVRDLRRELIGATNFNIFTTADKNQAYSSKYALFLVLLYLTLLQIKKTFHCSHRVEALMKYILKQIQKAEVKRELRQSQYYSFLTLITRIDQLKKQIKSWEEEIESLHSLMRKLMEEERQVATSVFPYYFNLFALVVNKQAIFMDNPSLPLIEYTFQNSRTKRFHRHFTRQDAEQYYREIQALSANQFKQEAE